jgi:RNA polymerase sigma factor (sigma-70 family)
MTVTDGAQDSLAGPDAPWPDLAELRATRDIELLRLVRAGYDAAFAELFSRHAATVRGFAARCCTDVADAEDLAAEAFFRVLQVVRRGSGPDDNVRAYLLTVVRRLAAEWSVRRRDVPVTDEELSRQVDAVYTAPASRADQQLIATAFASLPPRWRAVLWRVEVEGDRPALVAQHFGLSANATAALARRARQGLRAAYLQAHLAPGGGAHRCRSVVDKLGGFTAGQVTGAEARRIRTHLNDCPDCAALQAELADVCTGLRRYAGSLTAPAAGLALGAHHGIGGFLAKLAGHLTAAGARAKVVLAITSMAAAGGLGVAAGPIVANLHPTVINADRGDGVGPVLLYSVPGTSGHADSSVTTSSASPFDPTMRSAVRGPAVDPRAHLPAGANGTPAGGVAPVASTVTATQPQGSVAPAGTSASSGSSTKSLQMQAQTPPTTTTDSVPLSTTPAPVRHTSGSGASPHGYTTVWSTSWTSNGTTVYETVWSWSDTVH